MAEGNTEGTAEGTAEGNAERNAEGNTEGNAAPRRDNPAQQNVAECSSAKNHPRHLARYVLNRNELTLRQKAAAQLLLQGCNDSEAARQVGVDRMTIARWRKTPSFQHVVEQARAQVWQKSVGRLHSLIEPALGILEQQLNGENKVMAMRAAAILLRLAGPARLPRVSLDGGDDNPVAEAKRREQAEWDEIEAYINAPMPGQPGAP